jgi:hypothetical protein
MSLRKNVMKTYDQAFWVPAAALLLFIVCFIWALFL